MLAELLRTFPNTGMLNFTIEENSSVFVDLCNDLRKLVKKHGDKNILPLECMYLNKHALTALVGQLPQPVKHFALKRKPKSAALRAELLQKSQDAASNAKRSTSSSSVPIRCRGLTKAIDNSSPIRGIPSRVPTGGFKSPGANRMGANTPMIRSLAKPIGNKKDGGIKLLDINEQPMGYGREAKRRKKLTEELPEMQKKDKDAASVPTTSAVPTTPDYAVGLLSSSQCPQSLFSCIHPSFFYASNSVYGPRFGWLTAVPASPAAPYGLPATSTALPTMVAKTNTPHAAASTATITLSRDNSSEHATTPAVSTSPATSSPAQEPRPNVATVVTTSELCPASSASVMVSQDMRTTAAIGGLGAMSGPAMQHIAVQNMQPGTQQTAVVVTAQPQQSQQRPGLTLSRDQIAEAQEMFKNSNKVSRSEKALILGFMAGSRANPCPDLGNVITIRLSENKEDVIQPGGGTRQMIVETHFQMNYNTGEWKRVKKIRNLDE
ncbi:negative elongation factor A-like isoform X4 [Ornithodoros turicata]